MSVVVRMPQVATGASEAAVQSWLVAVGDPVTLGQAIVEIETEKAVIEYEAEAEGTVAGILVEAGAAAPVGAPIMVLVAAGESPEDAMREHGGAAPHAAEAETPENDAPAADVLTAGTATAAAPVPAAPAAGVSQAMTAQNDGAADASADPSQTRLFASPLVRRIAKAHGLQLSEIAGSGPHGRIVRRDLDRIIAGLPAAGATGAAAVAASSAAPVPVAAGRAPSAPASADYIDVGHTGMRRAIARRLTESVNTIPHFFLVADCRVDELLAVRARMNESGDVKLSVNDFVIKAVACAMRDVPEANAIWTDEATRQFSGVDIAMAVSVPLGLLTPVLRGVETLTLGEISANARELAIRARSGALKQAELEGGSFSISNLGMFETRQFSAIINPPHSGILAVGAAARRPVVDDEGALAVATVMTVTLSADHRVLDGALAARWLAAFQRRIENPLGMLV